MEGVVQELVTSELDRVQYRQGYIQALTDVMNIKFEEESQ